MDFDLPADGDPRRLAIRAWLAEHPNPSPADLVEAGYVAPHLPRPWGIEADPMHQVILAEELAGVKKPDNPIGIGWAAPTILAAGTDEQKARYLPKILNGEEFWCQLFSEPDAGSDLAALATRAVRDGDEYVVNGSKIWTSGGHLAKFGILIARTDPDVSQAPRHLVLHLPDGPAGHHAQPDRRHDQGPFVQPGLLRRRAHSRLAPCR